MWIRGLYRGWCGPFQQFPWEFASDMDFILITFGLRSTVPDFGSVSFVSFVTMMVICDFMLTVVLRSTAPATHDFAHNIWPYASASLSASPPAEPATTLLSTTAATVNPSSAPVPKTRATLNA